MIIWGADLRPRRARRPVEKWDSPLGLIIAGLWLVAVAGLFGIAAHDEAQHAPLTLQQRLFGGG